MGNNPDVVLSPEHAPHNLPPPLVHVAHILELSCRSEYARSEMGDGSAVGGPCGEEAAGAEVDLLPDLPPSWVPKLAVARDMMDMRCPRVRCQGAVAGAIRTGCACMTCHANTHTRLAVHACGESRSHHVMKLHPTAAK